MTSTYEEIAWSCNKKIFDGGYHAYSSGYKKTTVFQVRMSIYINNHDKATITWTRKSPFIAFLSFLLDKLPT